MRKDLLFSRKFKSDCLSYVHVSIVNVDPWDMSRNFSTRACDKRQSYIAYHIIIKLSNIDYFTYYVLSLHCLSLYQDLPVSTALFTIVDRDRARQVETTTLSDQMTSLAVSTGNTGFLICTARCIEFK